ncbi:MULTISPECIES: nitrate ABC transporter permease [unclassified Thioalkalivibrio]|uniref:nitrate ABC transporter permease n=1 Tax=unclassified Thioalkalivibrio TaxID=2621013 RepID=UPI0003A11D5F|nr:MULTISPECIES: nitrate ABC transporter permease [unclassified Thioalkalivibrio]
MSTNYADMRLAVDREVADDIEARTVAETVAEPEPDARVGTPGEAGGVHDDRFEVMAEKLQRWLPVLVLPLVAFALLLGGWVWLQSTVAPDLPTPGQVWAEAVYLLGNPFYDYGPNDMGIGWQVLYSLGRVLAGFGLAALVGIPLGLMMGASLTARRAISPVVQLLRPVSPLAWLPLGLLVFQAVNPSAIFVIFITSIWPIVINTAAGVQAIPRDYTNVSQVLRLGRLEAARKILVPATMPYILTGMRLALGIAWMVIVAAEMLTGGVGIGFFIWDEWNNLNVASIIVSIFVIGLVGIALDGAVGLIKKRFDYAPA